ncbi:hypothetical protein J3L18_28320 [Mucilaginibacter gossypii]|uniref:hypothetical protein n=1 Tax=Mucilaginibacter gossypii TaxID=551996 RepID=UPI000DCB11EF|nr:MULTISPECIES: hypothetical protein [Mucilaginibacter]QTE36973.1 hypothetical protein J3L18_28320 [Mucilaginibacter gossypii]RAV49931.1 hypothetical protein DIU36_27275 [Mucilaginibacter rubeus]
MPTNTRNAVTAIIYFAVSVMITAWFIEQKFGYVVTPDAILLSNIVAAIKWIVMTIAAMVLLKENKWLFIRRTAFASLAGSCAMFSVYAFRYIPVSSWQQFTYAMAFSLLVMTIFFFKAIISTRLSLKWFAAWLVCLVISIVLQVKVVFSLHPGIVTNEVSHFFDSRKKSEIS